MVSAVVADDHPVYRDGITLALRSGGIDVVGEACDGAQAVELAVRLDPDVMVLDLRMPVIGGLEALARLAEQTPRVRVLVLTMFEDDASVRAALRAGASGYLVKGASREVVVRSVQAVADGQAVYGDVAAREVRRLVTSQRVDGSRGSPLPGLSARELEVLDLVARGATNAEIARRLVLSDKTVRNHVSHVLGKLGAVDRAAAVAIARDAGLGVGAG